MKVEKKEKAVENSLAFSVSSLGQAKDENPPGKANGNLVEQIHPFGMYPEEDFQQETM